MIACPHARWFLLALNKHDTTAEDALFCDSGVPKGIVKHELPPAVQKTYCESGIKTTPGRNRLRGPIHACR